VVRPISSVADHPTDQSFVLDYEAALIIILLVSIIFHIGSTSSALYELVASSYMENIAVDSDHRSADLFSQMLFAKGIRMN